jgi:TonB-dependent receptor
VNSYIKSDKDYEEQVNAAYLMGFAKLGRLRLQTGLRWEETKTASKEYDPLLLSQVRAAGFPVSGTEASTIAGLDYRYRSRPRVVRTGQYDNWFPTFSAKYDIRPNLLAHFGYNQAIQRPGFNHVSGLWAVNEDALIVSVPNPGLLPENTEKYMTRLEYYFEPVGHLGVGAFQTNVENMRELQEFTAEEFGVDDPFYFDYIFRTQASGTGKRRLKGYEVDYRQQLAFLPGFLKGTSVYANYTRTLSSTRKGGVAPHHIKGGFSFRYRRFALGSNVSWYPDTPRNNQYQFRREYTSIALNLDYKLSQRTSLFVIGKNITNEVEVEAQITPDGHEWDRQYSHYGSIWTLGIRGTF